MLPDHKSDGKQQAYVCFPTVCVGKCKFSAMPFAVAFDTPSRREYNGGMKTKTSITLSEDVVKAMDKLSGQYKNRSEFIELALRNYIAQLIRKERNARDLEIINQYADRLNEEALDVLAYQVVW